MIIKPTCARVERDTSIENLQTNLSCGLITSVFEPINVAKGVSISIVESNEIMVKPNPLLDLL